MQSFSSRIWTRVVVSISYDDNYYTTGTSKDFCMTRPGIDRWVSRTINDYIMYIYNCHIIYIYIDIYIYHHHVGLVARISLTFSRHFSLSFIVYGRSSGLYPVSSHSCWMYVRAGRLAFARPYVGVHKSTSPMISSLLLQQCPACLVRLTWIIFVIGGRWPYS